MLTYLCTCVEDLDGFIFSSRRNGPSMSRIEGLLLSLIGQSSHHHNISLPLNASARC